MGRKRIGDVLMERGTLHQDELDRALAIQQEKNGRLGEVLMHSLHISKTEVASAIEVVQGVAYVECPPFTIARETLALVPHAIALKCCALAIEVRNNSLVVALAEPQDLKLLDELRFCARMPISPRFSFKDDILAGIRKFYEKDEVARELVLKEAETPANNDLLETNADEEEALTELEFIVASSREENREAMRELRGGVKKRTLVVRFLSMILARAAEKHASDLHIEPRVGGTTVRMRVDGILRELLRIPIAHQVSLISRIKTLADMDNLEQRLPQDGRFLMVYKGRRLDVRVSTLPTYFGEKIVLRILDPNSTLATFEQLGISQQDGDVVKGLLNLPQGMVIVTGPTSSGKSTMLYAALNLVSSPTRNIVTVEDPVEYMLDGITQVQVNARAGLTAASCLPPILRQNPNIIMVSDIRDGETAEIALRASQTGQLVLTALQTKDSLGAITRLRDLGVPSYLISAVSGIVGQRLLRTLCRCRKEVDATRSYQESMKAMGSKNTVSRMYEPAGCSWCESTGYKGRIGIYEVLVIDGMIRDAIQSEVRENEIRGVLKSVGFRTMQDDALEKVCNGVTTLEEVMRVVPVDTLSDHRTCHDCGRKVTSGFNFCPDCGLSVKGIQENTSHRS